MRPGLRIIAPLDDPFHLTGSSRVRFQILLPAVTGLAQRPDAGLVTVNFAPVLHGEFVIDDFAEANPVELSASRAEGMDSPVLKRLSRPDRIVSALAGRCAIVLAPTGSFGAEDSRHQESGTASWLFLTDFRHFGKLRPFKPPENEHFCPKASDKKATRVAWLFMWPI
jgi:hypothetical protein